MFSRRAPNLLLVSFIALWGIAGQPLNRDASAATRPAIIAQHGESGGAGTNSVGRRSSARVLGDPDDFTQTGGSEPKPVVPGSSDGRIFFGVLMDFVRAVGVLIGPR